MKRSHVEAGSFFIARADGFFHCSWIPTDRSIVSGRVRVKNAASLPAFLDAVHCGIGLFHEHLGIVAVPGENADPDACADVALMSFQIKRLRQAGDNLLCDDGCVFRRRNPPADHRKFVATHARHGIRFPETGQHPPASTSSRSPISWPSVSLIALNRSRSR